MMRVGIIQSNYIPWRGYFDFIDDVELFIIYDDVQYTKRDWRNRNKIKTQNGPIWLSVPVINEKYDQLINQTKIDYTQDWILNHSKSLKVNYARSKYFKLYFDDYLSILNKKYDSISELNVALIQWINTSLNIKTLLKMSAEFNPEGTKTDRLIDILKKVNATEYLSGPAAIGYIEYEKFKKEGISLEFKSYEYQPYFQLWGDFEGGVTVLDLLFNCGPESRQYLKSLKPNEKYC